MGKRERGSAEEIPMKGGERMVVAENVYRSGVSLKLNAGTNAATGRMIIKRCSLGKVRPGADAEAVVRIANLLHQRLDRHQLPNHSWYYSPSEF